MSLLLFGLEIDCQKDLFLLEILLPQITNNRRGFILTHLFMAAPEGKLNLKKFCANIKS